MVKDDKYSEKEFDSKEDMHLYWAENLMDELSSHDKEKAKKALRKKKDAKSDKREWRKKMMFRGTAGLVVVALVYLAAPSIAGLFAGGGTIDYNDLDLENQPMMGSEDAPVTVVEFGDYMCPACQSFEQDVKPGLMELIDSGDVKFYYMDINLPQFQPNNGQASVAAQCVFQQDEEQFWEFHTALFDNQGQTAYTAEGLRTLAEQNTEGLDYERLEECIDNRETSDAVDRDNEIARNNGVSSTPTVFVNEDRVSNWNNLVSVIETNYL